MKYDKQIELVDRNRELILEAFDYIYHHPETGYREWGTHAYLKAAFEKLGYVLREAGNIPGFSADLDTGRPGPTLAIFGELDALYCPGNPVHSETGAAHACGHCCQTAALLGVAAALREPGALDGLCGRVRLIAVPAEEGIELEYRNGLRRQGIIRYTSGKPEFMYRGFLDGVDLAMHVHTSSNMPPHACGISGASNGMIEKTVVFRGVASHAGGRPQAGVNALYAASLALNAINALRETFEDKNHIRVHPIITKGGDSVNVIPDEVKMESYVRGATMEAIAAVNRKVNRAIAGSAAAIGCTVHIEDAVGAAPRLSAQTFRELMVRVTKEFMAEVRYNPDAFNAACSDLGDISSVMPMLGMHIGGAQGKGHGTDYLITDPETACVDAAKVQLAGLTELLENGAAEAQKVLESYSAPYPSISAYLEAVDSINQELEAVSYGSDGSVTLHV